MSFLDTLEGIVGDVAPVVGSIFGGPIGAIGGAALGSLLGAKKNSQADALTADQVQQATAQQAQRSAMATQLMTNLESPNNIPTAPALGSLFEGSQNPFARTLGPLASTPSAAPVAPLATPAQASAQGQIQRLPGGMQRLLGGSGMTATSPWEAAPEPQFVAAVGGGVTRNPKYVGAT